MPYPSAMLIRPKKVDTSKYAHILIITIFDERIRTNEQKTMESFDYSILKTVEMYKLKVDGKYIFYYDETGNIRKLTLTSKGLNVEKIPVFVLGGIVLKNEKHIEEKELKESIGIFQKSIKELKFRHLSHKKKGIDIIQSEQVRNFFNWIDKNNFIIHLSCLDPYYFSIVDIIDSIDDYGIRTEPSFNFYCKSLLTSVLREDLRETENLFIKYDYPSVSKNEKNNFLFELIKTVRCCECLNIIEKELLCDVLTEGVHQEELYFIEKLNAEKENLIDNFSDFYTHCARLFPNSKHFFDEESSIKKFLSFCNNVYFIDSKTDLMIQISDLIVGFFGNIITYLNENNNFDIENYKKDSISEETIRTVSNLLKKSLKENNAFLHRIMSIKDQLKFDKMFMLYDD